jgi:hypothetical protein
MKARLHISLFCSATDDPQKIVSDVVGALVLMGYSVVPGMTQDRAYSAVATNACVVLFVIIEKDTTIEAAQKEIADTLHQKTIRYYSMHIYTSNESLIGVGNVWNSKPAPNPPPLFSTNAKHSNKAN